MPPDPSLSSLPWYTWAGLAILAVMMSVMGYLVLRAPKGKKHHGNANSH